MFGAIVITYNPDETFKENLKQITEQFDTLVIDNNSNNINYVLETCRDFNATLIRNDVNKGIGVALNQGVEYWRTVKKKFVITFDQDTLISSVYKKVLIDFMNCYIDKVPWGIVNTESCEYWEMDKSKIDTYDNDLKYKFVDEVISSGSIIPISIFDKLGLFWGELFIDQVDNEFCLRIINEGYKVIEINKKMKVHALGHIKEKFFLKRSFVTYNQSPMRYYYRTRNILLVCKKYKKTNREWCRKRKIKLIKDFIKIFFEDNKILKIKSYFRGFYDGCMGEK